MESPKKCRKYTKEEDQFIIENASGIARSELLKRFNESFNNNRTLNSLEGRMHKLGVKTGFNSGHFKKGGKPYNKGMTWDEYMPIESQKKIREAGVLFDARGANNCNHNHLKVGAEVTHSTGYTFVKSDKPEGCKAHRWLIAKQKLIYEENYGKVPKGYKVIFADGNKENFEVDNLLCVSSGELCVLNRLLRGLQDKELTKSTLLLVRLMMLRSNIERKKKKEKNYEK